MSNKAQMHGGGESSGGIVPTKRLNEDQGGSKEAVEGRPLAKENMEQSNQCRTQGRESGHSGLDRVREAAKQDGKLRFTALLHHVTKELLESSYYSLKRGAAAGVDGVAALRRNGAPTPEPRRRNRRKEAIEKSSCRKL